MSDIQRVKPIRRFAEQESEPLARPAQASPMVVQTLLDAIGKLNQKIDALAVRASQSIEHAPKKVPSVPAKAKEAKVDPPVRTTRRINRKKIRDMFD